MSKGIFLAVIGATAYGIQPLFSKLLINQGMNSIFIMVVRFSLMAMLSGVYLLVTRRFRKPTRRQMIDIVIYGILGYGGAIFLLVESYRYLPTGQATMIHFTYPVFVAVIMMLFYGERMTRQKGIALCLSILGIFCLMEFNFQLNIFGVVIAIISGICFGLYNISVSQTSLKDLDPFNLVFYFSVVVVIVFGSFGLITGNLVLTGIPAAAWGNTLVIALLVTGGTIVMTLAIRQIGPTYASIICVLEPVVSLICGVLFLHETLTIYALAGSALMMGVILMIALESKKKTT